MISVKDKGNEMCFGLCGWLPQWQQGRLVILKTLLCSQNPPFHKNLDKAE